VLELVRRLTAVSRQSHPDVAPTGRAHLAHCPQYGTWRAFCQAAQPHVLL